jgi:hypothetical protein
MICGGIVNCTTWEDVLLMSHSLLNDDETHTERSCRKESISSRDATISRIENDSYYLLLKRKLKSREEAIRELEHLVEYKSSIANDLSCKVCNLSRFCKLNQ